MSDVVTQTIGPSSLVLVGDQMFQTVVAIGQQGPVGGQGPIGVTGPPGPTGEQGIPGVTETYTFVQNVASSSWTIVHNLGAFLPVTVIDSANETVEGDVIYVDINTVILSFAAAFGGTAYVG